eukprot:gene17211-26425_t
MSQKKSPQVGLDDASLDRILTKAGKNSSINDLLKGMTGPDGQWELASESTPRADTRSSHPRGASVTASPISPGSPKYMRQMVKSAQREEGAKRAKKTYQANLDLLLARLEETQKERDTAEDDLKKARTRMKELQAELASWQAKEAIFTAAQDQLRALKDKLVAADAAALSAAEDLAAARIASAKVPGLEKKLQRSQKEVESLKEELRRARDDDRRMSLVQDAGIAVKLQIENAQLKEANAKLERQLLDAQQTGDVLEEKVGALGEAQKEIQSLRDKVSKQRQEFADAKEKVIDLEAALAGSERKATKATDRMKQAAEEHEEVVKALQKELGSATEMQKRKSVELLETSEGTARKLRDLERQLGAKERQCASMATELEDLHAKLDNAAKEQQEASTSTTRSEKRLRAQCNEANDRVAELDQELT